MRVSEMLMAIANWLESPNNEALLLAEYNEELFKTTAEACLNASSVLKAHAAEADQIEPPEPSLNSESLDKLAEIVNALDSSDDPTLINTASVIDQLLLTVAAPSSAIREFKKNEEKQLEALKKRYKYPKENLDEHYKVSDTLKAINDSEYFKEHKISQHPLKTRYCPDHPGESTFRVGDDEYQCPLDNKIYNYTTGYTNAKGEVIPGGSVANQTPLNYPNNDAMFDTRESRLNK